MRKRIIISFLLIISIAFTSCTGIVYKKKITTSHIKNTNKNNTIKVDKSRLDNEIKLSPYYKKIELNSGYKTLNYDCEKAVYKAVLSHCTYFTDEKDKSNGNYLIKGFTVHNCKITRRQLAKSILAVFYDNPQLFWLDQPYVYAINEDSVTIKLSAVMTKQQYEKKLKQLNAVINKLLAGLKKNMSEFELELYFHDYLVKNCKYLENREDDKDSYTIYGCLVNQSAVCSGYTSAFQFLLSCVGIESIPVYGESKNAGHVWNCVKIGGEWYYTDVTWDDTDDFFMYDNFNITSKQLKETHKIVPMITAYNDKELFAKGVIKSINLIIPNCTASKYNYYKKKGCILKSLTENKLAKKLASAAENRERYFYIYIDTKKLNYDKTYKKLFNENIFGFSEYIKTANAILGSNVLNTSVSVTKKKHLNTITVELDYN